MKQESRQKQSQEDILNEAQNEVLENIYGKKAKRRMLLNKVKWLRPSLGMGFKLFIIVFIAFIFFFSITTPPRYSDEETRLAEENLYLALDNAGEFRPIVEESLKLLENYPNYYRKVVNNISGLEVVGGICPSACIYYQLNMRIHGFTGMVSAIAFPEANNNDKRLIINPKFGKGDVTPVEFASMLVHETDHIEYVESGRLRRAALFLQCNALFNPHISINSRLGDLTHRIQTIEICAEKDQIRFHKLSDTKSGYEVENGIYYNFPSYMLGAMRNSIGFFTGVVRMIFRAF